MKCYHGDGNEKELQELVQSGQLSQNDADTIRKFRDFLREQAGDDSLRR